jgi:decaprenylphospho-beta-D-ribofuranose 2-oxidase
MSQAIKEKQPAANGHPLRTVPRMKPGSTHPSAPSLAKAEAQESVRPVELAGWGRYPVVIGREICSEDLEECTRDATLSRGLGRSYGDSSLPARSGAGVAGTRLADRLLSFDERSGLLRAEAGLSLYEINRLFLRRGWSAPVSPGTQFVTLGGMVAADVHGKNHHRAGCFGEHVRGLVLRVADGRIIHCSDLIAQDLFRATLGGMGLTGHILEVEFKMERISSPWIWSESERIGDLDAMVDGLRAAAKNWPFTVGWIDCLKRGPKMGRGILIKGRWANPDESPAGTPKPRRRLSVPFALPSWVLGRWSVRAFNFLYYWKHFRKLKRGFVHPEAFFYPLDSILNWNRIYGKRGFTQYQCVLPQAGGSGAARRFLELLTSLGGASFLSVIKDCGPEGKGLLSFPMAGISIALDLPIIPQKTQLVVDKLNELVLSEGGRIYLAKDALTRREHFQAMERRLEAWRKIRSSWDPLGHFKSAQSVRLLGDSA